MRNKKVRISSISNARHVDKLRPQNSNQRVKIDEKAKMHHFEGYFHRLAALRRENAWFRIHQ
jgi:hypothetical protein